MCIRDRNYFHFSFRTLLIISLVFFICFSQVKSLTLCNPFLINSSYRLSFCIKSCIPSASSFGESGFTKYPFFLSSIIYGMGPMFDDIIGIKLAQASILTVGLSLIHISEPTRLGMISYAVFCLKK